MPATVATANRLVAPIQTRKADANLTLNTAAAWNDVDASGSASARDLDVVIPGVAAGQWVTFTPNFYSASTAGALFCDVFTVVAGSYVNQFGTSGGGVTSWFIFTNTAVTRGGPVSYQVQAGDIENGSVRLRFRTYNTNATARSISSTGGNIAIFEGRGPFG